MGLPSRIPHAVGGGSTAEAAAVYTDTGVNYDVAIGGLPFMLRSSQDTPRLRRTADYRTQQIDQSTEPGEQSIVQWWIESQSTFHLGAGQKFMDTPAPGNEGVRKLRYNTSVGVDPWELGQVTLLKQTKRAHNVAAQPTLLTSDVSGATTRFIHASGNQFFITTESVVGGVPTYSLSGGGIGGTPILALASDGTNFYYCNNSFLVRTPVAGGASTSIYAMPSGTSSVVLGWVKSRLVAAVTIGGGSPAARVYTLDSFPAGSLPAAFPTENYDHPNPAWVYTSITEGPNAIYLAGFAGNHSTIDKFVLDNTGVMPTLAGASTAVELPPSEIVLGMQGYVSTVLGVATSKGFRVGTFANGNGDVQMGPLSLKNTTLTGAVTAADRFFYCGGTHDDGTAGLWRIDTSQPIHIKQFSYVPDEVFGYSTDLRAADDSELPVEGAISAVRPTADGRMGFLVPGFGLYVEHPTELVPSGTLTTSEMRYQTLDDKLCRFVRFRAAPDPAAVADSGTISVAISNTTGVGQTIGTLPVATKADTGDMATNLPATTAVNCTFTLNRAVADPALGPNLTNFQLKALPAQRRQRNIILPLSVFDNELDNVGTPVGGDGTALARLRALEEMEDASDIVTLQYLGAFSDQLLAEFVVIDKIEFQEQEDPTPRQGWGGVAVVTLRTVT